MWKAPQRRKPTVWGTQLAFSRLRMKLQRQKDSKRTCRSSLRERASSEACQEQEMTQDSDMNRR